MRLAPPRDGDSFDRSIDNRVARLRRKLEPDRASPGSSRRYAAQATSIRVDKEP
jgi:DNA-binding response OmpR family regulator